MSIKSNELMFFVIESNHIEGIDRDPTPGELAATEKFIDLDYIHIEDLEALVRVLEPGARLRQHANMDVQVGNHIAPRGGPGIPLALQDLLDEANSDADPYKIHIKYETLHPFMDGNGRSGRALWAWQMTQQRVPPGLKRGFLHQFYYQTLEHSR